MPYRIAVASSDGKVINQHFGRSRQFLIFEVTDSGQWSFVENRKSTPPCGTGDDHDNHMQQLVKTLSDCSKVIASQIGRGAEEALKLQGINAYTISDFIENALQKLIDYDNKQKIIRNRGVING